MEFPMGDPYFDSIRKGDFYYVDKTKYLRTLIKEGKYYFLSRPRRFGKSLLLSTLHNLFEGEKELFKGLYIYDHWEWSQKYFVINISFGGKCRTPDFVEKRITTQLKAAVKKAGLKVPDYKGLEPSDFLYSLLFDWHLKTGQEAVLLIDEYDKPILDVLNDKKAAEANEECLRDFYSIIKDCRNLRFVFVTGITMFSKATMFSGLNNLVDISLRPEYGAICGYTDKELDEIFAKEMIGLDRDKIRHWYNGYNWLGEKVYNPLSIMNLFKTKKFKGWWYQSSVPKYLYSFIKDKQVSIKDVVHGVIDEDQFSIFDPEDLKIEALLFQSGYLTIDQKMEENDGTEFRLEYPNFEVQKYLTKGLLAHITDGKIAAGDSKKLVASLVKNNFKSFAVTLNACLTGIPYQWHKYDLASYEAWYASLLYMGFRLLDVDLRVEESSSHGRSDMVLLEEKQAFVFEFKVVNSAAGKDKAVTAAIKQIEDKGYAKKYMDQEQDQKVEAVYAIALVFGKKEKNVVGWKAKALLS